MSATEVDAMKTALEDADDIDGRSGEESAKVGAEAIIDNAPNTVRTQLPTMKLRHYQGPIVCRCLLGPSREMWTWVTTGIGRTNTAADFTR
jgi:hypothetical protein